MKADNRHSVQRRRLELAAVLAILLLALGLRLTGIQFGKPYRYHPDEVKLVIQAGVLLDHFPHLTRDAIFNIGTYPPFFTYVLAGLFGAYAGLGLLTGRYSSVVQAKLAYYTNPFQYHLLGRVVVALSGVATVWLVFLLGRRLYGRRVAFASALVLSVLFLHVRNAHFATVDVPVTFLGFAAVAVALGYLEDGDIRKLWAGFALAGVATATKYQAGVVIVPIGLTLLLQGQMDAGNLFRKLMDWRLWAGVAIFVLVFLLACPMPLVDWHEFVGGLRGTANFESAGKVGTGGGFFSYIIGGTSPGYGFFARNSMPESMGWLFTALAVAGVFLFVFTRDRRDFLLAVVPVLSYLYLGHLNYKAMRHLLPLVPFLVLLVGRLLDVAVSTIFAKRWLRVAAFWGVVAAIALPQLRLSLSLDRQLRHRETRTLAKDWVEAHVAGGESLAVEPNGPELLRVEDPRKAEKLASGLYRRAYRILDAEGDRRIRKSTQPIEQVLAEAGVHFVIVDSFTRGKYAWPHVLERYPEAAKRRQSFYAWLDREGEKLVTLRPQPGDEIWPVIWIYRIGAPPTDALPE